MKHASSVYGRCLQLWHGACSTNCFDDVNFGSRQCPLAIDRRGSRTLDDAAVAAAEGPPIIGLLPASVELVLGNQIYVDRSALPPVLVNRIARLAAFQNPEFYAAQAMRLPTFGKPRIIGCTELFTRRVALPRGCLDELLALLGELGVAPRLRDEREFGTPTTRGSTRCF